MNIFKSTFILALLACTTAMAAPPSDASIQELLEITQARKMIDGMLVQMEGQMDIAIQKSLNGKVPSTSEQQVISKMKEKMMALERSELAWEKFEPLILRINKETFTAEEVQGMLAFYKTAAGQALINKMPQLMEKTMANAQAMIGAMVPRMQAIQKEFAADMKAANK